MRILLSISLLFLLLTSCNIKDKPLATVSEQAYSLTREEIEGGVMTPEILWKFGRVSDHQLSPDGQTIIFNVTRYDHTTNNSVTDIYSIPSGGGEAKKLTGSVNSCYNIRWKPDGSAIGYINDSSGSPQIWEMSPEGEDNQQVSFIEGGINGFEYSPSGNNMIFYTKDVKLDPT
ncbi:MAG: TolB family protein, partial [Bacteroidales bacterium]